MNFGIKGKYALITGGSHGIGRSVALALAREGCHVAICARGEEKLEAVLSEIKKMRVKGIAVRADVMIAQDVDNVIKTVTKSWGAIHILVNNAGGGGRWGEEVPEITNEEVWLEVYSKNALAAIRFTMKALPFMRRQKWGRVVTITSNLVHEGCGRPWFNMAKAAQTSLMKNLALNHDLARCGITFNSVAPGCIMIPDTGWEFEKNKNPKVFKKMVMKNFPSGRLGSPEEVASVVAFVCSEQASYLTGASITVDGGESKSF